MDNVTGEVELKARTGKGIRVDGVWYNLNGYVTPKPSFENLSIGDEVTLELNNKNFVNKVIFNGETLVQTGESVAKSQTRGKTVFKQDKTVRMEIARGTALKAVFGSPVLWNIYDHAMKNDKKMTTDKVASELKVLVKDATAYIITGAFDSEALEAAQEVVKEALEKKELPV